mmetsp:Transcript_7980/g.21998  ORF Transcript_7980/g.21998 Transcript_7980/m.21998 type:complete len:152 (+) Transcript_7980:396-851(+)
MHTSMDHCSTWQVRVSLDVGFKNSVGKLAMQEVTMKSVWSRLDLHSKPRQNVMDRIAMKIEKDSRRLPPSVDTTETMLNCCTINRIIQSTFKTDSTIPGKMSVKMLGLRDPYLADWWSTHSQMYGQEPNQADIKQKQHVTSVTNNSAKVTH